MVYAWGAVAAVAMWLVGAAAPATAAPPPHSNAPAATVVVDQIGGDTVTVAYSVNRAAHQVSQSSCALDGTAIACGAQTSTAKKLTSYSLNLTGLDEGVHVLTVMFALAGGETVAASAEFTIVLPTLAEVCADTLGGAVIEDWQGWRWACVADPFTGTVPADEANQFMADASHAMLSYCDGFFVAPIYTVDTHLLTAAVVCE